MSKSKDDAKDSAPVKDKHLSDKELDKMPGGQGVSRGSEERTAKEFAAAELEKISGAGSGEDPRQGIKRGVFGPKR
jgi:hypothetical protein